MYKIVIPVGFFPTDDEDDSPEELIPINDALRFIYDTHMFDYYQYECFRNWLDAVSWDLSGYSDCNVSNIIPYYFGCYPIKIVETKDV